MHIFSYINNDFDKFFKITKSKNIKYYINCKVNIKLYLNKKFIIL